jgi:hypothetical protein
MNNLQWSDKWTTREKNITPLPRFRQDAGEIYFLDAQKSELGNCRNAVGELTKAVEQSEELTT